MQGILLAFMRHAGTKGWWAGHNVTNLATRSILCSTCRELTGAPRHDEGGEGLVTFRPRAAKGQLRRTPRRQHRLVLPVPKCVSPQSRHEGNRIQRVL